MAGSFDAPGGPSALLPRLVAMLYALRCLRIASPAGVIGGTGSGLLLVPGPTHAPERSRFGAGPGGFGILGRPSDTNPSPLTRPCAAGAAACVTCSASTAASEARMELRTVCLLLTSSGRR